MDYLFISYSSSKEKEAKRIKEILEERGYPSWMAPTDIPYGEHYAGIICKAIRDCKCFLLLMSERVMKSNWVNREVERAISDGKPMFVLNLESCSLNSEFEFYLSIVQGTGELGEIDSNNEVIEKFIAELDRVFNNKENDGHPLLKNDIIKPISGIDISTKAGMVSHARELLAAMLEGPREIINILQSLNFNNINAILMELYNKLSEDEKMKISANLADAYGEALLDGDLTGRREMSVKGQVIFYLTRLECYSRDEIIKRLISYYEHEENVWQRQSIAYGLARLQEYSIPFDYAKKIYAGRDEDIVNRSWTLNFYGDIENKDPYIFIDDGSYKWDSCRMVRLNRLKREDSRALPYRALDLAVLIAFYRSRNYRDSNRDDLEIIKNTNISIKNLSRPELKLLSSMKHELIKGLKKALR